MLLWNGLILREAPELMSRYMTRDMGPAPLLLWCRLKPDGHPLFSPTLYISLFALATLFGVLPKVSSTCWYAAEFSADG
jgi:hypothetical protein